MTAPAQAIDVDVALLSPAWKAACPAASRLARAAARLAVKRGIAHCRLPPAARIELAVALADDIEQAQLNRLYRGKDGATNVLSFPAGFLGAALPPGSPLPLGDVVLAFETVSREARAQQKPLADHLSHLVVHGVLHLFGYDHESEADAARMESLERSILAELGVPDPYRDTM